MDTKQYTYNKYVIHSTNYEWTSVSFDDLKHAMSYMDFCDGNTSAELYVHEYDAEGWLLAGIKLASVSGPCACVRPDCYECSGMKARDKANTAVAGL